MNDAEKAEAAALEDEFPGWEVWVNLHGQWRARLRHSEPVKMLFDNSPSELRAQLAAWVAEHP